LGCLANKRLPWAQHPSAASIDKRNRQNMKPAYQKLKQALAQDLFVRPSTVQLDARLGKDLALSSLDFWQLVASVEGRLGIELPDADLARVHTVRDLVGLIERAWRPRPSLP
jgi:acyl carrier protein